MGSLSRLERGVLGVLGLSMIGVGIAHFTHPEPFIRIVPPQLPAPAMLVYISGAAEIAGGVGVLLPMTRRAAAWGLILLYIAVFPANIHMALSGVQIDPAHPLPAWAAWVRLPFQAVFIATAWWFTRPRSRPSRLDARAQSH